MGELGQVPADTLNGWGLPLYLQLLRRVCTTAVLFSQESHFSRSCLMDVTLAHWLQGLHHWLTFFPERKNGYLTLMQNYPDSRAASELHHIHVAVKPSLSPFSLQ